jgi:5-(aminomethyl)-3-furanmethanol phosphate kinase
VIDGVVKMGGSLLKEEGMLAVAIAALERLAPIRTLLVVPGGGPFADTVREMDRRLSLPADDAHWMAILGMEQFALLLAARLRNAELVYHPGDIASAHSRGLLPVLAPYRWLREADPLPHSWDVTSDSIAAWVAAAVGARHLILIKRATDDPLTVVDRYFERARPRSLTCSVVIPAQLTGEWFPA